MHVRTTGHISPHQHHYLFFVLGKLLLKGLLFSKLTSHKNGSLNIATDHFSFVACIYNSRCLLLFLENIQTWTAFI